MTPETTQKVTQKLIDALSSGTAPWKKTWSSQCSYNVVSGKPYRGSNVLWTHPMVTGFTDPRFMTYKQALDFGAHVRKGERGIPIVKWNPARTCKKTSKEKDGFTSRSYTFNASQIDGLELEDEVIEHREIPNADALVEAMPNKPKILYGAYDPCFSPPMDTVFMPERGSFESIEAFHETRFHELGHSTGHESRLNRDLKPLMLDRHSYGEEELVAEITSAFCCHHVGIESELQNQAAYCRSWLQVLDNNRDMIVTAAKRAEKAFQCIKGEI